MGMEVGQPAERLPRQALCRGLAERHGQRVEERAEVVDAVLEDEVQAAVVVAARASLAKGQPPQRDEVGVRRHPRQQRDLV